MNDEIFHADFDQSFSFMNLRVVLQQNPKFFVIYYRFYLLFRWFWRTKDVYWLSFEIDYPFYWEKNVRGEKSMQNFTFLWPFFRKCGQGFECLLLNSGHPNPSASPREPRTLKTMLDFILTRILIDSKLSQTKKCACYRSRKQ